MELYVAYANHDAASIEILPRVEGPNIKHDASGLSELMTVCYNV